MRKVDKPEQPVQRCMAERPEVSRDHSTVKGMMTRIEGTRTEREGQNNGVEEVSVR